MSDLRQALACFSALTDDGNFETPVNGVRLYKRSYHEDPRPIIYEPGLCINLQGHKEAHFADKIYRYDAAQYLVISQTLPLACETFGSPEEPVLGMFISLNLPLLRSLIESLNLHEQFSSLQREDLNRVLGPATLNDAMSDAVTRLLQALTSPADAKILGEQLLREVIYRALQGEQAPVLYSIAMHSGTLSQISSIIAMMQQQYASKIDIEQLAKSANMSVSLFHRAFKDVTSDTPIQYLKKIRLIKARDLILSRKVKTYIAALEVGYESSSQFNREFKRYFGVTPSELKAGAAA